MNIFSVHRWLILIHCQLLRRVEINHGAARIWRRKVREFFDQCRCELLATLTDLLTSISLLLLLRFLSVLLFWSKPIALRWFLPHILIECLEKDLLVSVIRARGRGCLIRAIEDWDLFEVLLLLRRHKLVSRLYCHLIFKAICLELLACRNPVDACALRHMRQKTFFHFFRIHFNLFVALGSYKGSRDDVMLIETWHDSTLTFTTHWGESSACILKRGICDQHLIVPPVLKSSLVLCSSRIERRFHKRLALSHSFCIVYRRLLATTKYLVHHSLVVGPLLLAFAGLWCHARWLCLTLARFNCVRIIFLTIVQVVFWKLVPNNFRLSLLYVTLQ